MLQDIMDKSAKADYPINALIAKRWSARAFSDRPVEKQKIMSLLEAARWAPSSSNEQPWRFIVFTIENGSKERMEEARSVLSEGNSYAKRAPVLMCAAAKKTYTHNDKDNRHHMHDVGAATAYMFLEAYNQGLAMHVMGGFDAEKARQLFGIPDGFEPATMIAIGYYGNPETLPKKPREKELAPRSRKPAGEWAFFGQWGSSII
ncbi:nitroreductase [Candidatus Nitrososphaera evergladensis SR1]|uniref:Nitroreductase n=1 Tax=Candidatus Nitrososphaera evergladensis SR1 TaxID=1459636 RepID=A0A075MQA9_9ARCH|nr:nitroreductase family protein [Candidatus Nitrososphaera evergladensis]AIF83383.1 nitroreductase [Candidatus Nitrososphaera evergladensis SR1]